MTDEASKTIFDASELSSAEKSAVQSGEARGKRVAMDENPERFGLAGEGGRTQELYRKNYVKAFGHD